MRTLVRAAPALALALTACKESAKKQAPEPQPPARELAVSDAAPPPPEPIAPLDVGDSEADFLRREEALPAWRAVTERDRLLLRRDDRGAVIGSLVADEEGELWLIDESEGAGSLGIRVELPPRLLAEPPLRAVLWGGWHGEDGQWIWRVERAGSLAGDARHSTPPGLEPQAPPNLGDEEVAAIAPLREVGKSPVWARFKVLEPPLKPGDGWLVTEADGEEAAARVRLPGEREPYGGQDLRADSERWPLRIGQTYLGELYKISRDIDGLRQLRAVRVHLDPG